MITLSATMADGLAWRPRRKGPPPITSLHGCRLTSFVNGAGVGCGAGAC